MGHMKERKKPRSIQIPQWMDKIISELAAKDCRNVSGEIEFLVASAIQNHAKTANTPDSPPRLSESKASVVA
jgi:hypothetical protein